MKCIPTMYNSREELILDLTIAGRVASSQPRSYDEMRDILFEEFKLNHPIPSLESKRYELSDKVSDDYEVGNEELKLGENEQIVNLEEDGIFIDVPEYTKAIPVKVREAYTYENQITEELRKKYLDFGIEVFDSENDNLGTVEQVRGLTDEEVDTLGTDSYEEPNLSEDFSEDSGFREDEGVSFTLDSNEEPVLYKGVSDFDLDFELYVLQYDLGIADFDYEFELFVKEYEFEDLEDLEEDSGDEYEFEDSEDLEEDSGDEYEFEDSDEGTEDLEEDSEDEYEFEDSEEDAEDEYEFEDSEDLEEDSEDEYEFEDDEEEEYEFDSEEDSEDEYEFEDDEEEEYEVSIGGSSNSWFGGADIEFDYEFEESLNEDNTSSEVTEEYEEESEYDEVIEDEVEYVEPDDEEVGYTGSDEDLNSDSDSDEELVADIDEDEIIFDEKEEVSEPEVVAVEKEKDSGGKSPPVEVEAVEEVLEDEPKDLRQFLRKHPRCDINFALKYFSKKEIEKAILIGKVVRRGNKLHI